MKKILTKYVQLQRLVMAFGSNIKTPKHAIQFLTQICETAYQLLDEYKNFNFDVKKPEIKNRILNMFRLDK